MVSLHGKNRASLSGFSGASDGQSCKSQQSRTGALPLSSRSDRLARDLSAQEAKGRATQGVRIMNVKPGDEVAAARIA